MKFKKQKLFLMTIFLCEFSYLGFHPTQAEPVDFQQDSVIDFQPVSAPFGETLCLGVKYAQGEPLRSLRNLRELKVNWVREELDWGALEPKPGLWRAGFPVEILKRLKFYREKNIGVIFLLGYGNQKAYPNDPQNPARSVDPKNFANWAVHIAELLKSSKVRFVLEILNEPHNQLPQLLGGNWQGAAPSPWVDHYAQMVHETVSAVHAFDPTIKLFTDDDMWIVHYWFLEAGLPTDISGFAIHPYTSPGAPEHTAVEYDTDWTRPFNVVDPDRSFRSAVRRLRNQGYSKLGKTPEIWITEWGWPVDGINGSIPEATLAAYLPRAYILAAAAGIKTTCWFSSYDAGDGPMGLTRNDGTKRNSYYAYQTLSKELANYTLVKHFFGSDHPISGTQGFLFTKGNQKKMVLWNIDGVEKDMFFPDQNNNAKAIDALGNPVTIIKKNRRISHVPVGTMPIYMSGSFLEKPTRIRITDE
jgi:Cellulase (glycosyl hydrolase family 5)